MEYYSHNGQIHAVVGPVAPERVDESEMTTGQMVDAYTRLTGHLENFQQEKLTLEATLKALGIRLPGMVRTRRPKAAMVKTTRTRKAKVQDSAGEAGVGID